MIEIPPEIEAEMTPAVKAFVLAAFGKLEARIRQLEEQVQKLTPRNSSLPPIQRLIESNDRQVKRMGHDLIRQQRRLFEVWRRYRAGEIRWRTFQSWVRPIRNEFDALLLRGEYPTHPRGALASFKRKISSCTPVKKSRHSPAALVLAMTILLSIFTWRSIEGDHQSPVSTASAKQLGILEHAKFNTRSTIAEETAGHSPVNEKTVAFEKLNPLDSSQLTDGLSEYSSPPSLSD